MRGTYENREMERNILKQRNGEVRVIPGALCVQTTYAEQPNSIGNIRHKHFVGDNLLLIRYKNCICADSIKSKLRKCT